MRVSGLVLLSLSLSFSSACHNLLPFERGREAGAPGEMSASERGGGGIDAPRWELGALDAARDRGPDRPPPDLHPWPPTSCAKPVATSPVLLSGGTKNASSPSVVAIGDTYYVAFVESGQVKLRSLVPSDNAAPSPVVLVAAPADASDPWLTAGPDGLALIFTASGTAATCPLGAHFATFNSQLNPVTPRTAISSATHGWGPATLVYDPAPTAKRYVVGASMHYSGSACKMHMKGLGKSYTSFSSTSLAGYSSGSPVGSPAVWFPTVALTGGSYSLLWLHGADTNASPPRVAPMLQTSTTGEDGTWSLVTLGRPCAGCPSACDTVFTTICPDALPLRPALVADGAATWLAWSREVPSAVRLVHREATTLVGVDLASDTREPSLARNPQVEQVAVAFLQQSSTDSTSQELQLMTLGFAAGTIQKSSGPIVVAGTSAKRHTPSLASDTYGFGVAWTQEVGAASETEVYFSWLRCD